MIPHSRPSVTASDIQAVVAALAARHYSQGPEGERLERMLAVQAGGGEAVAVSSGTAALYLALLVVGVKPGDEVIVPSYTCRSLSAAVCHAGARVVCADTPADALCLAPDTVRPLIGPLTKAIIAPHMFGFLADIGGLRGLGLPVIEDCAQAVGGHYPGGAPVGSQGDLAVFSFYATKLVPAGEGGACVTRNREWADGLRRLRNCDEAGWDPLAFNFKMADINAALACAKLTELPAALVRRESIARHFDQAFQSRSWRVETGRAQAVCFRYLVKVAGPLDRFLERSEQARIRCRRPVWEPLHVACGGACPRADAWHAHWASVPIASDFSEAEVELICRQLPPLLDGGL